MGILSWIIVGLLAGLLARAVVPGKQNLSLWMTLLLGLGGSLIGGFVAALISPQRGFFNFEPSGLIGSILGAIVLLLAAGWILSRQHGHPARA